MGGGEALLPDGRRVFAASSYDAVAVHPVKLVGAGHVEVTGVAGQDFNLESSTDLQEWIQVISDTFQGDTYDFYDATAGDRRFYRATAAP